MDKIASFIIKKYKLVIIVFVLLAALSIVMFFGVSVNYNVVEYLPDGVPSTQALSIMESEFKGAVPNTRVMVPDITLSQALQLKARIQTVPGVSSVMWLDDVIDVKKPLAFADKNTVENYYRDGAALFSVSVEKSREIEAVDGIYALIGENGAIAGDAAGKAAYQKLAGSETRQAMIFLLPIIIVILLFSTGSWFEPVIFLITIGTSVLLNMGSNLFFGEISFITNAISPILQLAVSLDYAIFLLHNFQEFRLQTNDIPSAMKLALKRSSVVILSSALTTFFGFIVLTLMRFKIGPDLGLALGKGIVLSLVSVLVFLPALAMAFCKLLDKTKHRSFMPDFLKVGKLSMRLRIPAIVFVAVLILPAFLAQRNNSFSYGTGELDPKSKVGQDEIKINEAFGTSLPLVVLVPRGDMVKEAELCNAFSEFPFVNTVVSYANMVGKEIPAAFVPSSALEQFYSENYARIIMYVNTPTEGDLAFEAVEQLISVCDAYYGGEALLAGQSANLYDMKLTVSADNSLVSLLAVLAIGLTILFSFKSLSLPVILVVTIETAIWINLSIPYFTGQVINYIGFLVINTVQLGATVDYAILYSDHYNRNRKTLLPKEAAILSARETTGSILVSGIILSSTGFLIGVMSTNNIVSELGTLLGRGTLLSMAMVLLFLPAMLTFLDKLIQKTTLKTEFINRSDQNDTQT